MHLICCIQLPLLLDTLVKLKQLALQAGKVADSDELNTHRHRNGLELLRFCFSFGLLASWNITRVCGKEFSDLFYVAFWKALTLAVFLCLY